MMIITVPEPVKLVHPETNEPLDDGVVAFETFVRKSILSDIQWRYGFEAVSAQGAIYGVLKATTGGQILLPTNQWKILRDITQKPHDGYQGYHPAVLSQLLPFINAIIGAQEQS